MQCNYENRQTLTLHGSKDAIVVAGRKDDMRGERLTRLNATLGGYAVSNATNICLMLTLTGNMDVRDAERVL